MLHYDACYLSWIRFSSTLAVGTSLVAAILAAASGAIQHWRLGNVDWKSVKHIAPAGVAGVLASSALFYYVRQYGAVIDLIVGLAFIWVAIRMVYEGVFRRQAAEMPEMNSWGVGKSKPL